VTGCLAKRARIAKTASMLRVVTSLLILSLVTSGVEAATDAGGAPIGNARAHEVHGDFHGDRDDGALADSNHSPGDDAGLHPNGAHPHGDDAGPHGDDGREGRHFCHCTVHAPAMIMIVSVPAVAGPSAGGSTAPRLRGTLERPPLLRPPNAG
jgi:hypothetical protein